MRRTYWPGDPEPPHGTVVWSAPCKMRWERKHSRIPIRMSRRYGARSRTVFRGDPTYRWFNGDKWRPWNMVVHNYGAVGMFNTTDMAQMRAATRHRKRGGK